MKSFKLFMTLVAFFGSSFAHANLSVRFDLESKIKEKVSNILQNYDPRAQVMISVELKKLDVVLPGVSGEAVLLESTATSTNIAVQDIQKVKVIVRAEKSLFPENLSDAVSKSLGIPKSKIFIDFSSASDLAAQAKEVENNPLLKLSEQASKFLSLFSGFEQTSGRFFYVSLSALAILFGILVFNIFGVLIFKRASTDQVKAIQNLGEEMKNRTEPQTEALRGNKFQEPQYETQARVTSPERAVQNFERDDRSIQSLSNESLVSLISDCYWSKKDGYAAYLWANMSLDQKNAILLDWKTAESYSEFLVEISPEYQNYHEHPYYFKASRLIQVSNEDLVAMVRADKAVWNGCSPIRKKEFSLSVIELVQLNAQDQSRDKLTDKSIKTDLKFNLISKKRDLSSNVNFKEVTDADELAIFENPKLIPASMRSQIKSLVWFAILPLDLRQSILHEWSANQLSEIWIGPEIVIQKLKEAISEKKLPLVQEYQSKITKTRLHPLMDQLTRQALSKLNEENETNKKAA